MPKTSTNRDKKLDYISTFAEESRPFMNLTKIYVNKSNKMPAPNLYQRPIDWRKSQNAQPMKGKFLKAQRRTIATEIIQHAKSEKLPGPGVYNPKKYYKVKGSYKSDQEQLLIPGEIKYYSSQTPAGNSYDPNWVSQIQI